jgi:methylmalonyl-CoA mutase N-terminal domain/subunit
MGLDSDDPMALGEVGRTGVPIDTLKDMERLFDQIDLGKVSTSMTINCHERHSASHVSEQSE